MTTLCLKINVKKEREGTEDFLKNCEGQSVHDHTRYSTSSWADIANFRLIRYLVDQFIIQQLLNKRNEKEY